MTTDAQEKIDKLPKWAQEHITQLMIRVAILQKLLGEKFENSKAYWEYNGERTYIPDGVHITFGIGDSKIVAYMSLDDNGALRIYGDTTIKIIPQAANSVHISIDDK